MYKAKASHDAGYLPAKYAVKCPVCGHDSPVMREHPMITCRCGAPIIVDHEQEGTAPTIEPAPEVIEMDAEDAAPSEDAN